MPHTDHNTIHTLSYHPGDNGLETAKKLITLAHHDEPWNLHPTPTRDHNHIVNREWNEYWQPGPDTDTYHDHETAQAIADHAPGSPHVVTITKADLDAAITWFRTLPQHGLGYP